MKFNAVIATLILAYTASAAPAGSNPPQLKQCSEIKFNPVSEELICGPILPVRAEPGHEHKTTLSTRTHHPHPTGKPHGTGKPHHPSGKPHGTGKPHPTHYPHVPDYPHKVVVKPTGKPSHTKPHPTGKPHGTGKPHHPSGWPHKPVGTGKPPVPYGEACEKEDKGKKVVCHVVPKHPMPPKPEPMAAREYNWPEPKRAAEPEE